MLCFEGLNKEMKKKKSIYGEKEKDDRDRAILISQF